MHLSSRVLGFIAAAAVVFPVPALAHSTVSPSQTDVSKNETYSVSVPTEKDVPTIGVRLLIPDGVERVTPLVKPGWRISFKKDAAGRVTQVEWLGGSIPAGEKDLFQFAARAPATSTVLIWKVYQTYRGGEVVAWDRDPTAPNPGEDHVSNPYSTTIVSATGTVPVTNGSTDRLPLALSVVAVLLSLTSLILVSKRTA